MSELSPRISSPLSRRTILGGALVAAAATLGACSARETTTTATATPAPAVRPEGLELPEGWRWVEGTGAPGASATPNLPATLTDATGTAVTVRDIAKVIVGGENIADALAALGLGANVYAAPVNSVSPAAVAAPEHFEFSKRTGIEGLLAVRGTLFIGNNPDRHGRVAEKFREAGVDALVIDDRQSVADKVRHVAQCIGNEAAGESVAAAVEQQLSEAHELAKDTPVTAMKILAITAAGAGGNNAVYGAGTAAEDIVQSIGAIHLGSELGLRGGSVEFSNEGLLAAMPDVIVMARSDLESWGGPDGVLAAFPTLAHTTAWQNKAVCVMASEQLKVAGVASGVGAIALAGTLRNLAA